MGPASSPSDVTQLRRVDPVSIHIPELGHSYISYLNGTTNFGSAFKS